MNDDAPLSTTEGIRPHTTRPEREYSSDDVPPTTTCYCSGTGSFVMAGKRVPCPSCNHDAYTRQRRREAFAGPKRGRRRRRA